MHAYACVITTQTINVESSGPVALVCPYSSLVGLGQSEDVNVRNNSSVILGLLLSVVASIPARAETDLTGKWVGTFNGVQVEIPLQPGPFGWQGEEAKKLRAPRFVEATLQLDVETQKKGLVVGTWNAGAFKQTFVCAQLSQAAWNCVDAGGRASIEIKSATEIRLCYLDNREGAQGAGCAQLRKSQ
jgi:hypothetical protein